MNIVVETVTCKRYYLVNGENPIEEVESLSDNIVELHSLQTFEEDSQFEVQDLTEEEWEDEVFKRARKHFVVIEEPIFKKKKRAGRPKGSNNVKK